MTAQGSSVETVYQDALVNYLISMARAAEDSAKRAIDALLRRGDAEATKLASEIFMLEPRINEMEIVIDNHAVRLLCSGGLPEEEIRLIVATLKITNDLERIGDLAVNIGERVISLAQMPAAEAPEELAPMAAAVRTMVRKSLGALVFRNVLLASEVLESDDVVDRYRDQIFERLLAEISQNPVQVAPSLQFILATRYLERMADHATNIAEDVIYWVRGLDVRHGRGLSAAPVRPEEVTEN